MWLLLKAIVVVAPLSVVANGWMVESRSVGAKDAFPVLSGRLISEELMIRLGDDKYTAEVVYKVGEAEHYHRTGGDMIFPVLCVELQGESSGSEESCVHAFAAEVNGGPVRVDDVEVRGLGYLLDGYDAMLEAGRVAALHYSKEGMGYRITPYRLITKSKRFPIADQSFPLSIKVTYS